MTYIHYGNNEYIPFAGVRNTRSWQKPIGGLWASREGDPNGWEAWCRKEEYQLHSLEKHFTFSLADGSRVLMLENEAHLVDLPKLQPWQPKDLSWMEKLGQMRFLRRSRWMSGSGRTGACWILKSWR